jgi:ferredoxin-NADP reductase
MSSHETEFDAVVVGRMPVADSIDVFDIARSDSSSLPHWQPGAHIDLVLPSGEERQYSLLPPLVADAPTWRIAVLREPSGRGGSVWLHDALTVGDTIRVRGPRNHFEFAPFPGSPVLLLAAGVGITPIASMARAAAASGIRYELHYSGRSRSALALLDEIGEATLHLSDEGTRVDFAELLGSLDPAATIYACGPTRFIEAVEAAAGGASAARRALRSQTTCGSGVRGGLRGGAGPERRDPHRAAGPQHPRGGGGGRSVRALQLSRGHLRHLRDAGSGGRGRPSRLDPHAPRAGAEFRDVHLCLQGRVPEVGAGALAF